MKIVRHLRMFDYTNERMLDAGKHYATVRCQKFEEFVSDRN